MLGNSFHEKRDPFFLVAARSDSAHAVDVRGLVPIEVFAEIEIRTLEETTIVQLKCDEKAAESPIPVTVRVDRFKLVVEERDVYECTAGR